MITSLKFKEDYELCVGKEAQKRFPVRHVDPTNDRYSRDKRPYDMFSLFSKNLLIEFNKGVNLIVGENGSGKSTLISLLKDFTGKPMGKMLIMTEYKDDEDYHARYQDSYKGVLEVKGEITFRNTIYFDGEKDNPIIAIPEMANPMSDNFTSLSMQLFFASEESHGESMLPALNYILGEAKGGYTIFMDEPETALSLKNQIYIADKMKTSAETNKNQLIVSTHSLAIINQFETVFDMETRKWVNSKEYVEEMFKSK